MYKLLVGLGNPGKQYLHTRHNLGAVLVQNYSRKLGLNPSKDTKLQADIAISKQADFNLILAIPTTYMNLSGQAVQKIASYYKIDPKDIYVAHDDLDIGVGESKIQFDRGPAGHNGIRSIIEALGTQAFWRIRIGIGHPQNSIPIEDYVLMPPQKDELESINQCLSALSKYPFS